MIWNRTAVQNCHHHSLQKQLVGYSHHTCCYSHLLSHYGFNKKPSITQHQQQTAPHFSFLDLRFFKDLCKYSQRLTRRVYRSLTVLLLWTVWDMETGVMRQSELHSWAEGNYRFKFRKVGRDSGMLPLTPYVILHRHKYAHSYQQLGLWKQVAFGKWKRSQSLGNICFGWI